MARGKMRQVVLKKAEHQTFPDVVMFRLEDKSTDETYWMPSENWENLGKPEEITIHVFPGDVRSSFPLD